MIKNTKACRILLTALLVMLSGCVAEQHEILFDLEGRQTVVRLSQLDEHSLIISNLTDIEMKNGEYVGSESHCFAYLQDNRELNQKINLGNGANRDLFHDGRAFYGAQITYPENQLPEVVSVFTIDPKSGISWYPEFIAKGNLNDLAVLDDGSLFASDARNIRKYQSDDGWTRLELPTEIEGKLVGGIATTNGKDIVVWGEGQMHALDASLTKRLFVANYSGQIIGRNCENVFVSFDEKSARLLLLDYGGKRLKEVAIIEEAIPDGLSRSGDYLYLLCSVGDPRSGKRELYVFDSSFRLARKERMPHRTTNFDVSEKYILYSNNLGRIFRKIMDTQQ